jgi:hypothetical protein
VAMPLARTCARTLPSPHAQLVAGPCSLPSLCQNPTKAVPSCILRARRCFSPFHLCCRRLPELQLSGDRQRTRCALEHTMSHSVSHTRN